MSLAVVIFFNFLLDVRLYHLSPAIALSILFCVDLNFSNAVQDDESKDSLMREMRCRKENIGTHSMRMPGVRKDEDADVGFCQDGSRTNERGEAEQDCCPR